MTYLTIISPDFAFELPLRREELYAPPLILVMRDMCELDLSLSFSLVQ